ncbi:hypothetical protein KBZ12_16205 [Cyanobium sp. Cruz CV13-4-11]|jgi:hypothetical protein|uniref:hypothetical protein n=1 Tax=unclassified Cyanobium TaxID=2627006 RepID=UPI0020CD1ECA|nr:MULTISPECIES: hypothetical protein [unclassified Cyanobium]MCP9902145.1 hypothetical protein [Cyanobium sp. Cruz CV11-17]MCP9920993.1 hypothetical protein [Cyanobium sp. Cruz CV13-4-11]
MTDASASVNLPGQTGGVSASETLRNIDKVLAESAETGHASAAGATTTEASNSWTPRETMMMSGAALGYSLIVLLVAAVIAKGLKTAEQAIRLFTVVLIINSAVFFIVAGYSSQQIAPAFGLLGTMAGYVLGKSQENNKSQGSGE